MNVTAEHAGGAVVLELDEGCRSVAALRRIISAALPDVREDGFDVTVQGRAVEDVDVCGLEEGRLWRAVVWLPWTRCVLRVVPSARVGWRTACLKRCTAETWGAKSPWKVYRLT